MKNPTEATGKAVGAEKGAEKKRDTLKVCNPSVCIGNQKPTSCVCPTEK